jgi:tellurite resistance protein
MKKPSESAQELKTLIKRAIADLEITPTEYDAIMNAAHDDGNIDSEEQALLAQFQQMLGNGTIKRVKG